MTTRIAYLPGDGIGVEVLAGARRVLEAAQDPFGLDLDFVEFDVGGEHYLRTGKEWADGGYDFCRDEADAILLGAIGHPEAHLPNGDLAGAGVIFGLRFGLDLYCNLRPVRLYPGVRHRIAGEFKPVWDSSHVDLLVLRENTEGAYAPVHGTLDRGGVKEVAIDSRIITRKGSKRLIELGFKHAVAGGRQGKEPTVTCVDKSNVMDGCRLFRSIYDEVASGYPQIQKDYAYVDAFTQWLVRDPQNFDVVVTTNMLGDIVTDLAAVLQGGMGMAPSGNIGEKHAMFEPVHGSAPKYTGLDQSNPIASILAGRMMLEWLGERKGDDRFTKAAQAIETAVSSWLVDGKAVTYDLGGTAKTSEVAAGIAASMTKAAETS